MEGQVGEPFSQGTHSCSAMSDKTNNKEREKKEGKENIPCEVHGGPHIKQIKNLNALKMMECS